MLIAAPGACSSVQPSPTSAKNNDILSLIFVRHGRTEWNLTGRYQGRSDPPLSPEGEVDAESVAQILRADAISSIIVSPLQRATATARIIGDRLGRPPIRVDDRLMEVAYGAWEGLTQSEIKQRWPAQLRQWKQTPATMRFPDGETLAEARSRLVAFLEEIARSDRGACRKSKRGPVLVVGHGGLIRLAILEAKFAPLTDFRSVEVEPGSVHRFLLTRGAPDSPRLLRA